MYAFVRGILIAAQPAYAIVDVQGVGYQLFTPCRVLGELPSLGQEVFFFTTFVVRELSHALYGFLKAQERDLFEILMDVSGVGPKLALSLIGHLSLEEMQRAVALPDFTMLCKVPGVGKKTAERLVVELRDKLPKHFSHDPSSFSITLPENAAVCHIQDAMSALVHLGYHQNVAQKAVKLSLKEAPDTIDLPLLITLALKHLQT